PLSLLLSCYRARFLFSRVLFSLLKLKDQKRADTHEPLSSLCKQASASLDLGLVIDTIWLATTPFHRARQHGNRKERPVSRH
ncbi:unnamed protein product, partial [Ixodes persulcatus]